MTQTKDPRGSDGGYATVGKPLPRLDGPEKALGTAVFGDDVSLPGELVGRILRSPLPHARIVSIDVEAARSLPGVHAVLTGGDIPDVRYGTIIKDRRALALEKVRHVGDPVALVAAEDGETAEAALGLIRVEFEELPALFDPVETMAEEKVLIHEEFARYEGPKIYERRANICTVKTDVVGDPDAAWDRAEIVIEGEFDTHGVHAGYIEPHAALASVDRTGKVTVWTTTQGSFGCRDQTARVMGLALHQVNVIPTAVGGGFGAKMPVLIEPLAALLAAAAGRPVKILLSREEDTEGSTPRHPTVTRSRLGADREGNLLVREVDFYMDTGAYADFAPNMANTRAQMAVGPYRVPNARVNIYAVYTNKPSCSIVRAPAGPQLTYVTESQMDELARRVGLDPFELRARNSLRRGDEGMDGKLNFNISLPETLSRVREAAGPPLKNGDGRLYGRGVASSFWKGPAGAASCSVRLDDDGTARVITGSIDITGSSTSIAQVVAEELGLGLDRVSVITADTDSGSLSPGSGGSQVTRALSTSAQQAALSAKQQILETAAAKLEAHVEDLVLADGRVTVRSSPELSISLEEVLSAAKSIRGPIFGHGISPNLPAAPIYVTQVADVAVDPETGEVEILRVVSAQDVGFAINPLSIEGQIEGAVLQGMGYATMEELKIEDGRILNPDLDGYILPTAQDAFDVVPIIVEEAAPEGAYGVRGVGEPPIICTLGALANAVYDASGVRVTRLPISPERVVKGLRENAAPPRGGLREDSRLRGGAVMADTLIEVFEESVRAFAGRTVSEREGGAGKVRALTYAEFAGKSRGVAWQLSGLGVRPGDNVGVLSDNRPEWGIAFFGVLLAGAVVIPLDIHLKPAELANILSRSGARVCVAGAEADETLAGARPSTPALDHIVSMDDAGFGPSREDSPEIPPPDPDAVAVIPFSSGTTGVPKGVMLSQRNLASNVQSILDLCIYETGGNLLSILPLHHTFELTAGFLTPFAKGVKVFYLNAISPRAISAALAEREITVCLVVPALVRLFHKNIFRQVEKQTGLRKVSFRVLFGVSRAGLGVGLRLGKVFFGPIRKRFGEGFRYFFSGGAALDPNVERDLRVLGLEVLQGYGLTETSPVSNVNPPGKNKIGTVGPPVPRVEVKLGPVEGAGPGEGEVLIRGPNVMLGYFENPEGTAEVLVDGWFHTGDIGRLDGDGYLSICGRSKSVIVSEAGKNIYPEEVEDELMQSPYFQEVCVLGRKSEKGGEEVFAVIVPNEDAFKDRGETGREEEIIAREVKAASSRLADYKRVQKFGVVDQELPKTTTLKHKRPEIVKLLEEKGIW